MLIGLDFDNTIVSYNQAFHEAALEQGLIPAGLAKTKLAVRDYLRAEGREEAWTLLQGEVYGPQISKARPFPGVRHFFEACARQGVPLRIVSHKTRQPYLGPPHNLHAAAAGWLLHNGFYETGALSPANVFFELTKKDKADRIRALECTHFVDDLPEFLAELEDIPNLQRILFDPNASHAPDTAMACVGSFAELARLLLPQGKRTG